MPILPSKKWYADPSGAFDHLSRYGPDALLLMDTSSLWRRAGPPTSLDEESLSRSFSHRSNVMAGNASVEASFEVRAVAAQIGWLETYIPVAAAEAIANVELFLSSGFSEHDEPVHHQLRVQLFEVAFMQQWV